MRCKGLLLCVMMAALSGCAGTAPGAGATPMPPKPLTALPTTAWIRCTGDPDLDRGGSYLWELPGLPPDDPNSAYQGKRGRIMAKVTPCMELQAVEFDWSETDKQFWVRVRAGETEGWITLDLLEFEPPAGQSRE